MIEINWGVPLTMHCADGKEIKRISTIEQAQYWLQAKWPVASGERDRALRQIDAAMNCLIPVGAARAAFLSAAATAGFAPSTA